MTLCPHCRGAGRHPLDEAGYGAPEHRWIVCECRADDPREVEIAANTLSIWMAQAKAEIRSLAALGPVCITPNAKADCFAGVWRGKLKFIKGNLPC